MNTNKRIKQEMAREKNRVNEREESGDRLEWKARAAICPTCGNAMFLLNGFYRCPGCGYKESCCY